MSSQKGFSLVAILLVLVAIIVVGVGAIYLINPLEKARESRDKTRLRDIEELSKAIKIYLRNNSTSPKLCNNCTLGTAFFSAQPVSINSTQSLVINSQAVNGTGWVPIDLSLNAGIGKTPLLTLSVDPINKEPFVYTYTPGSGGNFKLTTSFESKAFYSKMVNDGGTITDRYEIGTDLTLIP